MPLEIKLNETQPSEAVPMTTKIDQRPVLLAALSFCIVSLAAGFCYVVIGGLPLIGIDDAAITRNYAENIARGDGIVYFVGGERVEGATSFFWTVLLAGIYAVFDPVEPAILGLSFIATVVYVWILVRLLLLLAEPFSGSPIAALLALVVGVLALPGFFFWSVFSMMENAVWSVLLILLVWRLAALLQNDRGSDFLLFVAAALLPLTRPEGVAVACGLLALAAVLRADRLRLFAIGIGVSVISVLGVTAFRMVYFGFPVPNTYYAKVSSDRMDSIVAGAKYLMSFALEFPFLNLLLVIAAGASIWALWSFVANRHLAARGLLVVHAAIFGTLGMYVVLGGDHFVYWRLYQPVVPLLLIAPALLFGILSHAAMSNSERTIRGAGVASCAVAALGVLAISYGDLRQERFRLRSNFELTEQGQSFGKLMSDIDPDAVIGIGPAGGIALSYPGPIRDLFGLNWVEMAHAETDRTGLAGHSGFDRATFWKHPPDLVAEVNRPCREEEWSWAFSLNHEVVFKGLFLDPEFQARYTPVRIMEENRCWRIFAANLWLEGVNDPRFHLARWQDLTLR